MLKKTALSLFVSFFTIFSFAQTPVSLVTPPSSVASPPPLTLSGSCGVNYPQLVQIVCTSPTIAVTGTFKYQLNGITPAVSESRGLSALGGNAFYTYATPITSGLVVYPASNTLAITTSSTLTAATTVNYTVYVFNRTSPGYTSGATSVCTGDATNRTITLGGGSVGQVVRWEASTDGGATWGEKFRVGTSHNHNSTLTYSGLTTTTYYRAVVQSGYDTISTHEQAFTGACTLEYSSVSIVTVYPYPTAPTVGSNSPVCSVNDDIELNVSTVSPNPIYTWTGPGGFTSGLPNPTIPAASAANAGIYSCTVKSNGCTGPAGTTTVVVNPTPPAPTLASNTPVCTGNNVNLSVPTPLAGASYNWVGPNSFNSTVTNPTIIAASIAASGTYSATATVAGCTGVAGSTTLVMNQTPIAPIAGSNSKICEEQDLNLTATTIAGASYTWTGPNGFAPVSSPAAQNPTIVAATPAATGTYTVFATVAGCPGASTSANVVVNALPAVPILSSNTPVCQGTTLALSSNTLAGATYNWIGPNGFSSTIQNPTILSATPAAAGSYTATVNVTATGCTSHVGTTAVIINPTPATPTALSNSPVCFGGTLNLTASTIAGATYAWTGPNGFTSASQNPSLTNVTAAATGAYSVIATVSGCVSAAGTVNVVISPNPDAPAVTSNSAICDGADLNLFASNIVNATYSWTGPNGFTSTSQNPVLIAATTLAAGTYSVIATVAGCISIAGTTDVIVNPLPAAPVAGSNSAVCSGASLNLAASAITNASYSWTGPNSFTANSQNPSIANVTTSASGTYSVRATVKGCLGAVGTTLVTVNATPSAPLAGSNSPICSGTALNLAASTTAGATYNWSGPNGFTSTGQNPTITPSTASNGGTYFVSITVSGCTSSPGITSVTVNTVPPAPVAGSNSPACVGADINLTASPIVGATYYWTGPNAFTSSFQNPGISNATIANAGLYNVYAAIGACTGPTGSVSVVVNPSPAVPTAGSNGPVCVGTPLNLAATPTIAGATYAWTGPNGFTSAIQNPTLATTSAGQSGTYSVIVSAGGCPSQAGTIAVDVYGIPPAPTVSNSGPVCSGTSLDLFASPIAGAIYSWTGPNGFTSPLQNPSINNVLMAAAGTYTVFVKVNGCTGPAGSTTAIIKQTPSAPLTGSNSPLCEAADLHLTASAIAGATYKWDGPNSFTSTLQNPNILNVTVANAGTYFVAATVNGCTGPSGIAPVSISVSPTAPTAANDGPICEGGTLTLSANKNVTVVGAVYNWTGPNGFTSSEQFPVISNADPAASGTYTVVATVGGGCTGPSTTTTVMVYAAPAVPVVSSNSPVCTGNSLNLFASAVPAGSTFSWNGPNAFSTTTQVNPSFVASSSAQSGIYTFQTKNANGCFSDAASVTVIVNTTPNAPVAANDGPFCPGATLHLTAGSITGATYAWTGPNGFTSPLQNPVITPVTIANAGTYNVTATLSACGSLSGSTNVVIQSSVIAGTIDGDKTLCGGPNSGTLILNGSSGSVLNWKQSTDNGQTWVVVANTTTTQDYLNLAQTTMYEAVLGNGDCPIVTTLPVTITVVPEAVGGTLYNSNPNAVLCENYNQGTLTLVNYQGTIVQWEQTNDGGATWDTLPNTTDTQNYVNLTLSTSYRVLLAGCSTKAYSEIGVLPVSKDACGDGLVIATLVTPNGDNNNDTWLIEDLEDYPPLAVTIVNRYGTQLYHSENYKNDWDCKFNGDPLPDGTYYYVISVTGTSTRYKGNINILK